MYSAALPPQDALTGASSRAEFDATVPTLIEHAAQAHSPVSLFVFDVDHFKTINDAYGHRRGDDVLREVVRRARSVLRPADQVFRYGGDEFVVVLPGVDKPAAAAVARNLLAALTSSALGGDPPVSVSVSVGIATAPEDGSSVQSLFQAADRRSYQAKRRGRAQVVTDDAGPALVSLLPGAPPSGRLLEREEALETVQRALASAEARAVIRVAGAPGSGRTRFLFETATAARLKNLLVFALCASSSRAARAQSEWDDDPHDGQRRQQFRAAVSEALLDASASGVVITVDDLPALDFGSFDWLRQLLQRSYAKPLVIVYSTDPQHARSLIHPAVELHATVDLEPLTKAGVRLWLRSFLRWEPPAEFADWIAQQTAGLPAKLHAASLYLIERDVLRRGPGGSWSVDPAYPSLPLGRRLGVVGKLALHNLPAEVSPFIGRQREIETLNELIDSSRLITLKGPGGIGKTRLSLHVAALRTGDFADGVRFVPLAALRDPQLLPQAIGKALGVREAAGRSISDSVRDYFARKDVLLVLDNFEQVTAAAPFVSELLRGSPRLKVLITSREPLRLTGEHVYEVPPLELPHCSRGLRVSEALASPAIALFVARAQVAKNDFQVDEATATELIQLCARLDALPLAIELAAARCDELTPSEMLNRGQQLLFALSGPRDTVDRHRTLRQVIQWSYELLAPEEQALFVQLAVFRDGFTAAAADAIGRPERSAAELLQGLADKSLLHLVPRDTGEPRYDMLETVRQYAAEALASSGEEPAVRARYCEYFSSLVRHAGTALRGGRQLLWLHRLDAEHPNLTQALEWALVSGDLERAIRICSELGRYWELRGYWSLGRRWCERLLAEIERLGTPGLNRVLLWAGRLASLQGDRLTARPPLMRALALSESVGDTEGRALCLLELGWLEEHLGLDYRSARRLLEGSLRAFEELGDTTGRATVLVELGRMACELGQFTQAEALCEESLTICREVGYPTGIGKSLLQLAQVKRARGHFAEAMALLDEYRAICEMMDDKSGLISVLVSAAELCRSQRQYDRAIGLYEQNIALCRQLGDKTSLARSLKDIGEIARYRGDLARASALYEESAFLLRETDNFAELPWVLRAQAEVQLARGELIAAQDLFRQGIELKRENIPIYMMLAFSGLIAVAERQGDLRRAARLIGAADHLLESVGSLVALDDRADYSARVDAVRARLDPPAFEAAHAEGYANALPEAVLYALDQERGSLSSCVAAVSIRP